MGVGGGYLGSSRPNMFMLQPDADSAAKPTIIILWNRTAMFTPFPLVNGTFVATFAMNRGLDRFTRTS
jgi:hypothetical protein